MGFNIEQYELYDAYSNVSGNDALRGAGTVCVKGNPVYGIPLTYAGFQMTKKGREKISENRQICQARYSEKQGSKTNVSESMDVVPTAIDAPKPNPIIASNTSISSVSEVSPKSKTGLYIGIGVGVLAVAIVTVVLLTRKK